MPRVGRLVLLASAAAAAVATLMTPVAAQSLTCSSVPASALSFTCGSACTTSQACVGGGSARACKCLDVGARRASDDDGVLRLLIPFGKFVSDEAAAAQATASETISGTNDTKVYASASNDVLNRVEKLSIPKNISTVVIRGGSSLGGLAKHTVANVSFDPKFLTDATNQVKLMVLENLALGSSIDTLAGNFPLAIYQLQLRNTLIKKFPTNLQKLGALRYLHLSYNDIETIEKDDRMPDLLTLYLRNNKIKAFNALFPKLSTLDLTYNKLDGVPDVIAQHTSLKLLYLGGADNNILTFNEKHAIPGLETLSIFDANLETFDATLPNLKILHLGDNNLKAIPPKIFKMSKLESLNLLYNKKMLNVSLTNVQANFIYNLKNFSIDATSLRTDCDASQKYEFTKLNVTMCLSEPKNVAVIEAPRIVVADDKKSGSGSGSANAESSSKKSSSNTGVIIGVIAGAVVVIAIIAAVVIRKKKSNRAKAADALTGMTGTVTGTMTGTNGTSLWIDQDLLSLKVSSDDIQDVKKIGNGAFADVWLVKFRGSELMASKRLRESGVSRPQVQSFIDEIKLVSTLKHPCIVELKGVAWVRESDLQALFEYMDSGDLRDYLVDAQGPIKWNAEKLQVAIDVAEALVYVHSFMPPLVHRDLKSRNVLLSSNNGVLRAKLTDFGVSRFRSEDNTMTSGVGTGRWLAPEVISGDGNYGPAADIFSFGALLYELDTHQIPYSDVRGANGNKIADVALLQLVATGELTPHMSASCPTKLAELANRCFALSPSERPAAPEIAYALRTLQKSMKF